MSNGGEVVKVEGEELQVLSDLVAAPITGQTWLRQANAFTEAGYKISIYGKRILWLCLSEVKGDETHPGIFTVTAKDYYRAFGVDRKTGNARSKSARLNAAKEFKRGFDSLMTSGGVKFRLSPGKYESEYLPWFKRAGTLKEGTPDASFFLEFNPLLWRRMIEVKGGNFTRLDFIEVDRIPSAKQARLYELCRLNAWCGGFEILLADLIEQCQLSKSEAARPAELKRMFLDPALAKFKALDTPLHIRYEKTEDGYRFVIFDTLKMEKANTDGLPVEPVEELPLAGELADKQLALPEDAEELPVEELPPVVDVKAAQDNAEKEAALADVRAKEAARLAKLQPASALD